MNPWEVCTMLEVHDIPYPALPTLLLSTNVAYSPSYSPANGQPMVNTAVILVARTLSLGDEVTV